MREFAAVTGGGFVVLFFLCPLVLKHRLHLWPLALAVVLGGLALLRPAALKPVHRVWMAVGHALGWVNSRIILSVIFYGIFFPVAWVRRRTGKGSILGSLRPDPGLESYRVPAKSRGDERAVEMERPF
jgi:hypothetical protein